MPASDLVTLSGLMADAKCFALVRQHAGRAAWAALDAAVRRGSRPTTPEPNESYAQGGPDTHGEPHNNRLCTDQGVHGPAMLHEGRP